METTAARIKLRHFEDVLPVEFKAINARRKETKRHNINRLEPKEPPAKSLATESIPSRKPSPDPDKLFPRRSDLAGGGAPPPNGPPDVSFADPHHPDYDKTRPVPVPCDATGLAFSGGGIRSAAVCLGALQALHRKRHIEGIDYFSTVSGGGYIGSCLGAAMSNRGGRAFPFGEDVSDNTPVLHLRNYSNYLLPRGRSGIRNVSEAAAVILRGLLANIILVLVTLLGCALVTQIAYPNFGPLQTGSFVPRLIDGVSLQHIHFSNLVGASAFRLTLWFLAAVVVVLIIWAALRSVTSLDTFTGDTDSWLLTAARVLLVATVIVAFLDLQPLAIELLTQVHDNLAAGHAQALTQLHALFGVLIAFGATISVLSSSLGHFLKTSQHARDWTTLARRGATHFAVFLAARAGQNLKLLAVS